MAVPYGHRLTPACPCQAAAGRMTMPAREEAFIASMRHYVYRTGHYADLDPGWRLSHKQLEICHRIDDKLQMAALELPVGQDPDAALLAEDSPLHDAELED